MAEMTSLERALRILQRLSTHDRVTVEDLHRLFDERESRRTIQRTLESIQTANVPLLVERGAHNTYHYSLRRAFDYIPQPLEPDEILAALLLAPFSEMFAGTRIGEDLAALFDKIDHLVPPESVAITTALAGLRDAVQVREPGTVDLAARENALRELMRAILERRRCEVVYASPRSEEPKRFEVEPHSLVFHAGAVYAVVRQPKYDQFIYLAVQRIEELLLREESFQRNPAFSLGEFLADNFGIWRDDPVDILLRFDPTVAHTVRERVWHPSQDVEELEDGSVRLRLRVGPTEEFIAWVLRWGHYAEVLEPASLRTTLRERIERMGRAYREA